MKSNFGSFGPSVRVAGTDTSGHQEVVIPSNGGPTTVVRSGTVDPEAGTVQGRITYDDPDRSYQCTGQCSLSPTP